MGALRWCHGLTALAFIAMIPFLSEDAQLAVFPLTVALAILAILVGVRRHRPAHRAAWLLIAAAAGLYLLGHVLTSAHVVSTDVPPPFPWLSDVAFLALYGPLLGALALFIRARGHDRQAWLDGCIWALGGALLIWKPVIERSLLDVEASDAARAVATAYAVLDLCLLLFVVRLLTDPSWRRSAGLLVASSLLLQVATDMAYGVHLLDGLQPAGGAVGLGWLVAYGLLGAGALHPDMVRLTARAVRPPPMSSRGRLFALSIPAVLGPGLLAIEVAQAAPSVRDVVLIAVAFPALFVLVAARANGVVTLAERQVAELAERQGQLEVALRERDNFTGELQQSLIDRQRVMRELRQRVDHDTLTGLASRDRFVEALTAALRDAAAGGPRPSVALLDLDDFKTVNDTLGHAVGDELLIEIAHRLTASSDPDEVVARFGGDEFAVLVLRQIEPVADRLLAVVRAPVLVAEHELAGDVSIGLTTAHSFACDPGEMLREADLAMYAAKAAGGGWAAYRPAMSAAVHQRLTLRARLLEGVAAGEVEAWYQPVVDLQTGDLLGFEALARWCQPGQAPLAPGSWLPWAEETGLVAAVDRAVMNSAVQQLGSWRRRHGAVRLDLAVNLSGRTLQTPDIDREVLEVLRRHDVPADRLIIEVTEGVLIDDERIGLRLQRLRAAGVRIALDDFGTGWSSLSNLRRLPVDELKLDRSFTAELGRGAVNDAVPSAIIQLSRALSLAVVAEGVETDDQRNHLIRLGYTSAQGYLFSGAQPARELTDVVSGARPAAPAAAAATHRPPLSMVR